MKKKVFEGCAICQFNLYITVKAEDKERAEEEIDMFLDCCSEDLETRRNLEGVKVYQIFDECFEIIHIEEVNPPLHPPKEILTLKRDQRKGG